MGVFGDERLLCSCTEDNQDFLKLVELKETGLVIYWHSTRTENVRRGEETENITDTDVFIFHNTKDEEITPANLTQEIEKKDIDCPRCLKRFQHAQELMEKVTPIDRKNIVGVCDHCRGKAKATNKPCCTCENIVKKFISVKGQQNEDTKKIIKMWLIKLGNLLNDAITKEKSRARVHIDRVRHSESRRHEPEVEQMFPTGIRRPIMRTSGPSMVKSGKICTCKVFPRSREEEQFFDNSHPSKSRQEEYVDNKKANTLFFPKAKEKDGKQIKLGSLSPELTKDTQEWPHSQVELFEKTSQEEVRKQKFEEHEEENLVQDKYKLQNVEDQSKYVAKQKTVLQDQKYREWGLPSEFMNVDEDKQAKTKEDKSKKDKEMSVIKSISDSGAKGKISEKSDIAPKKLLQKTEAQKEFEKKIGVKTDVKPKTKDIDTTDVTTKRETKTGVKIDVKPKTKDIDKTDQSSKKGTKPGVKTDVSPKTRDIDKTDQNSKKSPKTGVKTDVRPKTKGIDKTDQSSKKITKTGVKTDVSPKTRDIDKTDQSSKKSPKTGVKTDVRLKTKDIDKTGQSSKKSTITGVKTDIKPKTKEIDKPDESTKKVTKTGVTTDLKTKTKEIDKTDMSIEKEKTDKKKEQKEMVLLEKQQRAEKLSKEKEDKAKQAFLEKIRKGMEEKGKQKSTAEIKSTSKIRQHIDKGEKEIESSKDAKIQSKQPQELKVKKEILENEKLNKSKDFMEKTQKQKEPLKKKGKQKSIADIEVSISKIKQTTDEVEKEYDLIKIEEPSGIKVEEKINKEEGKIPIDDVQFRKLQAGHLKAKEEARKKKLQEMAAAAKALAEKKAKDEADRKKVDMKNIKFISDEDNQILKLVQIKKTEDFKPWDLEPKVIEEHRNHHNLGQVMSWCAICINSDLDIDLLSYDKLIKSKKTEVSNIIIGEKVYKYNSRIHQKELEQEVNPLLFPTKVFDTSALVQHKKVVPITSQDKEPAMSNNDENKDELEKKGIIRYALSDRTFIDKGWTILPTEKVVRKMNVYRMRPAHPEFDWFEHNKKKGLMTYDTGDKLAEFDDKGRGRWYYRSGQLALDYYDAKETNAQQRLVVYSSGEPDERGRTYPVTILATFDYLGNGVVFDHAGKIRLKYNQTEGVVLDRQIGPVSHWKWHTLNDPPVLQQVMMDTYMTHKDPKIIQLGKLSETKVREDNEEMLAIEFDNFVKEKKKKLTQKFKPFQIKMKALKINEQFSLKVLDQATVHLIFKDGSTHLKLNIGMVLDPQEIIDTDTAELSEVPNNLERYPARTDSIAELQRSVAYARQHERQRSKRERWLKRPVPCASVDHLAAAASPSRPPLKTVSSGTICKNNLYYNTRFFE